MDYALFAIRDFYYIKAIALLRLINVQYITQVIPNVLDAKLLTT